MLLLVGHAVDEVDQGVAQRTDELVDLLRTVLQVVVHRDRDVVGGSGQPRDERVVLTVVATHQHRLDDPGVLALQLAGHGIGVVDRAVHHQDDLVRRADRGQDRHESFDQRGKRRAGAVARDDDRQSHAQSLPARRRSAPD